ncbi:MAG: hypothetical protein U0228_07070 [Myxococcaceae bacterium]
MHFVRLEVKDVRAVREVDLALTPGLNVLHGPNDLGKSTLAFALRSALVLPGTSSLAETLVPWGRDAAPWVRVTFRDGDDWWRVSRTFTSSDLALEQSSDGANWRAAASGKKADERIKALLSLGVPATVRGTPASFLLEALFPAQSDVESVLRTRLDEDGDDSGQARLSEVLASLGRDARVAKLVARAEKEVARAFTATGKRKGGKGSALARAAADVERLTSQLEQERHRLAELTQLASRIPALESVLASSRAKLDQAGAAALAAETQQAAARRAQEALQALVGKRTALERQLAAAREKAQQLQAAHEQARRAHDVAAAKSTELERAARDATAEKGEAKAALLRAELQEMLAGQQLKRAQLEGKLEQARAANKARARVTEVSAAQQRLAPQLAAARQQLATLREEVALTTAIIAYGQWRSARDAREGSKSGGGDADRSTEQRLAAELEALPVPSERAVTELRSLKKQLELAEAALGGGFTLTIRPRSDLRLRTTTDDGPASEKVTRKEEVLDAERRATVQVGDQFDLEVMAGAPEKRADVDHLKRRWKQEGLKQLEAVGLRTLDELESRLAAVAELNAKLQAVRAQLRAGGPKGAVPSAEEVEKRRARIGGLPLELLEKAWNDLGPNWESATSAQHETSTKALDETSARVAKLEGEAALLTHQLTELGPAAKAVAQDEATLARALEALDEQLAQTQARLQGAAAPAARGASVGDAKAAKDALREASAALERADQALRSGQAEVASLEGALREVREQLAPQAVAPPVDLSRLQAAVKAARAEVDRDTQALGAALGGLERGGLAAAEDAVSETTFALERARAAEARLAEVADGWKLLLEELKAADREVSADLGRALSGPVSKAFAELTRGRYGAVSFDESLTPRNVQVGEEVRDDALDFLSVGTKDQLATVVRLALATQLKLPVVLDDHLVHSDAARLSWFRDALAEAAAQTQVLVITCRPTDYVPSFPKSPRGVRLVDLEGVIKR